MGRLIDADALKLALRKCQIESLIAHNEEKNVFDIINEQPTAYDVEKAIEELCQIKKDMSQGCENVSFDECWKHDNCAFCVIGKALDIVKRGGE